jgi:hypothetical protein
MDRLSHINIMKLQLILELNRRSFFVLSFVERLPTAADDLWQTICVDQAADSRR